MSNKERCLILLNDFSENQLADIAVMLEAARALTDDDKFCRDLYESAEYDKSDAIPLEDFAQSLGVSLG